MQLRELVKFWVSSWFCAPYTHDKDPQAFCSCSSDKLHLDMLGTQQGKGDFCRASGSPRVTASPGGTGVCLWPLFLVWPWDSPCILRGHRPHLSPAVLIRGLLGTWTQILHVLSELQSWQGVCGKVQHSRGVRGFCFFFNCFVLIKK